MPAGLAVEPSRLISAGSHVHSQGQALALAGRDAVRGLDEVDATIPAWTAAGAALELAAAAGEAVRCLVVGLDALAAGLDAAAARYVDVDVLSGRP